MGNIRTFLIAWLQIRAQGGTIRLRIEDLDHPKHKPGATEALIETLQWLGFDWDGPIEVQSQRLAHYDKAFAQLADHCYPCTCTRADIQSAQSAPHAGEILRYPGTCRSVWREEPSSPHLTKAWNVEKGQAFAWRFALMPEDERPFTDSFTGTTPPAAATLTGDFVLARSQLPTPNSQLPTLSYAYTLAVVVDDAEMGITDVVRGDDLLLATPTQCALYKALGYALPRFWHVPLVVGADGRRLAKRHGDTRICAYRDAGISPSQLLTVLARSCRWLAPNESIASIRDLIPRFKMETIPQTPLVWDDTLLTSPGI